MHMTNADSKDEFKNTSDSDFSHWGWCYCRNYMYHKAVFKETENDVKVS